MMSDKKFLGKYKGIEEKNVEKHPVSGKTE